MSRRVNPAGRLSKRRHYRGCIYEASGGRACERSGAEWLQLIAFDGLRVEANEDASLACYKGADLRFEIYEDSVESGAEPVPA